MLMKCPVSRVMHTPIALRAPSVANPLRRPCRRARGVRHVVCMATNDDVVMAYATGLASLAESQKKLEVIHNDMDRLATIIQDTAELTEFLSSPFVEETERRQVLATVCGEAGFDADTVNFLNLVMDKGRSSLLTEICDAFEEEYCRMTDTQVAVLTSAAKLDDDEQFEIAKKLQELSGASNVKVKPVLDPSLIGGFVIEFGSSQIDMSIRGQLKRIRADLSADSAIV